MPTRQLNTNGAHMGLALAGALACMAFFASPAMAQAPSTYQGHLDECLAQAKRSQESLRRGIEKRTAEGDTAKVEALTKRLAEHLANSAQKCETFSRDMAEKDAKIAAADAKIAAARQETERNQAIAAAARQETERNQAIAAAARQETE
ncbi:MAG TPA: hypothetical protein PK347_03500, partial [Burkholderiaceae bacterium]|nr:hypothetical protein [Burkholderiaceae bacterium]